MMQELKFEELTPEQKIGMVTCGLFDPWDRSPETDEFLYEHIRNHSLGCVWVYPTIPDFEEVMAKIKELADYPLLIITDAETGMGEYTIPGHNTLGVVDSEELAYEFGKVTAITAYQKGFNIVCNPVLDMKKGPGLCGGNRRSLGSDKHKVAKLGAAIARGMHDGGVLTVGKHYPSAQKDGLIDSHMAETSSSLTKEDLLDDSLFPYLELMKEGLLDGIMTGHCRLPNIDPDYPASLSKKVISIIREQGFDGLSITDGLSMMGIVAKFGATDSKGLAVENGNDIALVWCNDYRKGYSAVYDCYKRGLLSDERLDEATRQVLAAQHKVFEMQPKYTEITQDDIDAIERINTDSVYARTEEGLSTSISRDGKHLFIVVTDQEAPIKEGKLSIDTFSRGFYNPVQIIQRLSELFPNSEAIALSEFPSAAGNNHALHKAVDFDDVVLITKVKTGAYVGREEFTPPLISLIEAMQVSGQISTIVHFSTPYALEALPHIPRVLIGAPSKKGIMAALEVLAGNYPAKGTLTYSVNLK